MDAAYTAISGNYPAYINARVEDGEVVVRARTKGDNLPSEIHMPADEWYQWLAAGMRIGA